MPFTGLSAGQSDFGRDTRTDAFALANGTRVSSIGPAARTGGRTQY
jgi:hypothetical protein